ncbi:hypothetical protein ABZY57_24885 [Streptomyces sp. NPDC006450]|uniref:hypothetical protein n=1 Tax=Streptomyces sp. NPDC006450 TaxID=3155458 RepID=UPI0033A5C4E3
MVAPILTYNMLTDRGWSEFAALLIYGFLVSLIVWTIRFSQRTQAEGEARAAALAAASAEASASASAAAEDRPAPA